MNQTSLLNDGSPAAAGSPVDGAWDGHGRKQVQAGILSREGESLGRVYGPDHYAGTYRTVHGLVND